METVMGVERQIPEDLKEAYAYYRKYHASHLRIDDLIERIADLAAEVERLKGLLREYRQKHNHDRSHYANYPCELCKRTDQQLQPKGEQG